MELVAIVQRISKYNHTVLPSLVVTLLIKIFIVRHENYEFYVINSMLVLKINTELSREQNIYRQVGLNSCVIIRP